MSAKISSRQRMLAAIKRQQPDRVPCSPYLSQGPWLGEPLFWRDQIERTRRLLELGLDPNIDVWLPDPQLHPDVKTKTWREKKGNQTLLTKEYHTPAGTLRQVVRETEDWYDYSHTPWVPTTWGVEKRQDFGVDLFDDWAVSRRLEPWVKGRDDLEKLRYLIRPVEGHLLDQWRMDAEQAMEFAERFDVLSMARRTIVGDAFQWLCDIPWFMIQLYEDPEFVKQFLGIFQDWGMALVRLALEIGVDVVQYRGWYETPTFWGPRFWKEYLGPCINEQARLVHSAGKLVSYLLPEGHGAYSEVLRDLDVDVLQGVDPRKLQGGDLRSLFARLGQGKAFWGGVNAEVTLESKDYDKIDQEVKGAVDALAGHGGFILSAFIYPPTPMQGILHMIEAWKKHNKAR
jgi:uroporphyrinogen-III decarboxylase